MRLYAEVPQGVSDGRGLRMHVRINKMTSTDGVSSEKSGNDLVCFTCKSSEVGAGNWHVNCQYSNP